MRENNVTVQVAQARAAGAGTSRPRPCRKPNSGEQLRRAAVLIEAPRMRPSAWHLTWNSMFASRNAVSLSSFGGEGQGEEAVALDMPARWRSDADGRVNVKTNKGLLSPALSSS